jgi:signal peptidase II
LNITSDKPSLSTHIKNLMPTLAIALFIVLLDQVTKSLIRDKLAVVGTIEVIRRFFELSYSENTGAAFGSFQGRNGIFIVVNFLAIIFIFIYYNRFKENMWMRISLGFILGGAIGNLMDRIFIGFVTDFIRIHLWNSLWWPNFNIADAGVTIGAIMLIIVLFIESYKTGKSIED